MEFRSVTPADRALLTSYLLPGDYQGCEYSFGTLFIWQDLYHAEFAVQNDILFLRAVLENGCVYYFPAGPGDLSAALDTLGDFRCRQSGKLRIVGLSIREREKLEQLRPGQFAVESRRDSYDYIYNRADLAELAGKKYHGKRNHVNKYVSLYGEPQYESIDERNIGELLQVDSEWRARSDSDNPAERAAIERALDHYFEIGMKGGLLRVDGRVIAFTLGSEISKDVFDVHIEKANTDYAGAFTVINQQFVRRELTAYRLVNREEDMGIEGLRKAKLSYYPAALLEKFIATLTE